MSGDEFYDDDISDLELQIETLADAMAASATTSSEAADLICDDCRKPYPGPVYYSVDPDVDAAGNWHDDGSDCTGSFCPDCAGPYLSPDIEDDPRRPVA